MNKVMITTSGEYSDYRVVAVFLWKSDKTPEEVRDLYLEKFPKQKETYHFDEHKFCAWVVKQSYAEDFEAEELFVGAYGVHDWKRKSFPPASKGYVYET